MTDNEIDKFIERLGNLGDEWTPEQVKDVYGDMEFNDAVDHREPLFIMHLNNMASLIE